MNVIIGHHIAPDIWFRWRRLLCKCKWRAVSALIADIACVVFVVWGLWFSPSRLLVRGKMIEVRIDPKFTTTDHEMIRTYFLVDEVVDYLNDNFGNGYWNYKVMNDKSDVYHWLIVENDCKLFVAGSLKFNDLYGYHVS